MLLKFDKQFENGDFQFGIAEHAPAHNRRRILVNNIRRLLREGDDYSCMGFPETLTTEVDEGLSHVGENSQFTPTIVF